MESFLRVIEYGNAVQYMQGAIDLTKKNFDFINITLTKYKELALLNCQIRLVVMAPRHFYIFFLAVYKIDREIK